MVPILPLPNHLEASESEAWGWVRTWGASCIKGRYSACSPCRLRSFTRLKYQAVRAKGIRFCTFLSSSSPSPSPSWFADCDLPLSFPLRSISYLVFPKLVQQHCQFGNLGEVYFTAAPFLQKTVFSPSFCDHLQFCFRKLSCI